MDNFIYVNGDDESAFYIASYFDSCGVEHIPKEIQQYMGNKNIINVYFCIAFIEFMLKGRSLFNYTHLFSPNKYAKNNKITLKYFQ